jgi:prophage antirepressor-like protein
MNIFETENFVFDVQNHDVRINGKQITMVGTFEDPYFCAKEVAEALGYKDVKKTLQYQIDSEYKCDLQQLETAKSVGGGSLLQLFYWPFPTDLDYHSGKAVYLSEQGVYELTASSQLLIGKQFKKWLFSVLKEIRTRGKYELEQKLKEKDTELQHKDTELQHKDEELQKQERFTNKLRDMVITMKARQKDQIIYITTTNAYARQNRFKVGGVKSRSHLKNRLAAYNSGRPVGDKMYYAFITETTDYHHLEQRISKVLGDHKDTSEAEMYNVHYNSLQPLIEYLADRFDEEIQHHRKLFENLIKETVEKPPTIPEPIILNGAEFRRIKDGEVVLTQKLDFDIMADDEKKDFVSNLFEQFLVFNPTDLTRKDFEDFVAKSGAKFSKRNLWIVTKEAAKEFNRAIKY